MGWRQCAGTLLCLSVALETSVRDREIGGTMSAAPPAVIEGEVKDERGEPVPTASVIALPESGGIAIYTTTDVDGRYHFEGLSHEPYRIDVSLPGFVGWRQNHVRVGAQGRTRVDVVLSIRPICECISLVPHGVRSIPGQVVDEAGRPLPHALLEVVGAGGGESARADSEGRFEVRPPPEGTWTMAASDSGYSPVLHQISSSTTAPLVLRLPFIGTQGVPDIERFNRDCICPGPFGVGP